MKKAEGFTVIEMLIFFIILAVLAVFFIVQKSDLDASYADRDRKSAINSIYYNLTEVFQPEHGYFPQTISIDTLRGIDQMILTDDLGYTIGDPESSYSYEGLDCNNKAECKEFKLVATLEKEANYEKSSAPKD